MPNNENPCAPSTIPWTRVTVIRTRKW
jgi:hypothetical protein